MPENHSTGFKTRFSAKSPGANGLIRIYIKKMVSEGHQEKGRLAGGGGGGAGGICNATTQRNVCVGDCFSTITNIVSLSPA